MKIGVILLAGGLGLRMGSTVPKQFLPLNGSPIALHSFRAFEACSFIEEIIVVANPHYHHLFTSLKTHRFAMPGLRRQDSVFNGLQQLSSTVEWVLVHDAARPFIAPLLVEELCRVGKEVEAAALAMPIKVTVKEACPRGFVQRTLDRSKIWEIQTPQLVKRSILEKGFAIAEAQNLVVTDDVSLAELAGVPVKLVCGSFANIKITTKEDLRLAELLAQDHL